MLPSLFKMEQDSLATWRIVSEIIGWTYFFVWSISFYPQVYLNWKRKSVKGLSIDFLFYNVLGFFCYSIFNMSFYFDEEVKKEYQSRHPDGDGNLVRLNDVVFAIHGFIISLLIILQTCIYKKHETQKISSFAASSVWLACIGAVLVISTVHYGGAIWLDFMYYLSSVKLIVSFIKYLPQVWINYKRQSTQGWSVQYILWDLSGGVLSIIQLLLDAYIDGDWSGIEGDNVKLGLGVIVIGYDLVFLLQHYVLYYNHHRHITPIPQERRSLLIDGRVPVEDDDGSVLSYNSSINRRPINANRNYGSTNISLYAASV